MPNLDPVPFDGRIPKQDKLRREVVNFLSGRHPSDAVIALTDVYTGTTDFANATDAKAKMHQWVENVPTFFPHVALHDFESWLLPYWQTIQQLAKHNRGAPAGLPEDVNHNKPPSKHLEEIFRIGGCRDNYTKERDAKRILKGQNLLTAVNACGELKQFVNRIITLSNGPVVA